jgi:hypothetical protein
MSILGDIRLDSVLLRMVTAMSTRLTVVIRKLGGSHKEQICYDRFINNTKVTPDKIVHLSEAEQASFKKAAKKARRHAVYETPFEDKESYRWLNVVKKAIKNCPLAARYTAVGDRESDIYEVMSGFKQAHLDFVIRSSKDRNLSVSSVNPQKAGLLMDRQEDEVAIHEKLYEKLNACAILSTYEIDLPKTNQRSAHTAKAALKYCPITLKCPNSKQKEGYLQELPIYAVQITECPESVVGHEKPIHWILLTSHPVETIEQALEIIQWCRYRWIIEQSFRTTKTKGLSIESSQAKSYEALAILITLALIASVQVMQLVQAREGQTHQSIETVFSPIEINCLEQLNEQLEGKTEKQQNPHPQSTLAFASWVIARLGGWAGFKSQRPPGPITMREGMIRFYNILVGFEIKLQN